MSIPARSTGFRGGYNVLSPQVDENEGLRTRGFFQVWHVVERLRRAVEEKLYLKYSLERSTIT